MAIGVAWADGSFLDASFAVGAWSIVSAPSTDITDIAQDLVLDLVVDLVQ